MRRTANEWKITIDASIEWISSSAGAQNHNQIADVELIQYENAVRMSEWIYIWRWILLCISNAWHTQFKIHSCYRVEIENERIDTKKGNKRKVEEKVAAQQQIVGTFSLYQVLKTIGYVPVRLVISYHICIMWMRRKEKKSTKRVIARGIPNNIEFICPSMTHTKKKEKNEDLKRKDREISKKQIEQFNEIRQKSIQFKWWQTIFNV